MLRIAESSGIPFVVEDIAPGFVARADGAFLCGTACEMLPVAGIDGQRYGVADNKVVHDIRDAYMQLCRSGTTR